MGSDDRDLLAVRALVGQRAEAGPGDLARLRARVVAGAPRRRARWVAPVAAGVVALVLAGGIGLALRRGDAQPEPVAPTPRPSLSLGPTVDAAAAFAQLERGAAGTAPVLPKPHQLLRVREDMLVTAGGPDSDVLMPQLHVSWYEPEGMILVREEYDGVALSGPKGQSQAEQAAEERADFAAVGAGMRHPTPGWLASLGPDPDTVREVAQQQWGDLTNLMYRVDPLLPAMARAGLLRLMAAGGGVAVSEVTFDGRRVFGLRYGEGPSAAVLLLDPGTAHVVGRLQVDYRGAGRIQEQRLTTYEFVAA